MASDTARRAVLVSVVDDWRPLHDVRHITLPEGTGPYTVQAGMYNAQGRYPVFHGNTRCQDDAATVATITP